MQLGPNRLFAGNLVAHHVTFGDFMAGDFLGGYRAMEMKQPWLQYAFVQLKGDYLNLVVCGDSTYMCC